MFKTSLLEKKKTEKNVRVEVEIKSRVSSVGDPHLELGDKAGEFLMPVVECGCWRDDEEWTPDVVSLCGTETRVHCQLLQQVVVLRACANGTQ